MVMTAMQVHPVTMARNKNLNIKYEPVDVRISLSGHAAVVRYSYGYTGSEATTILYKNLARGHIVACFAQSRHKYRLEVSA